MQKEEALIIFVKNPVAGRVKTRLAETVGAEKALVIYHKLLGHTQNVTRSLAADKQVWYSRFMERDDGWDSEVYKKRVQKGDDLGERMQYAFQENFHQGYRKVVIIGSDCAELTTAVIEKAFSVLDDNEVVIGPSIDGGYYLLGMSSYLPMLFEGVAWSTPKVMGQTLAKIQQHGLSLHLLPRLNDIDYESDWNEVKKRFL